MKSTLVVGALAALATGLAIGVQSTLSSRLGPMIGNLRTGLLMNLSGGTLAGLLVAGLVCWQGWGIIQLPRPAVTMLVAAGALGVAIVTGVTFSLQRTGVAAGLAGLNSGSTPGFGHRRQHRNRPCCADPFDSPAPAGAGRDVWGRALDSAPAMTWLSRPLYASPP